MENKCETVSHLSAESGECSFGGDHIRLQRRGPAHNVPTFAHRKITQKRNHISGNINQQNSANTDVVVHKAYDRPGDQPSALYARQQERVGVHEFLTRSQFLNQRGNGRPEHPEARGHQRIHQV